MRKPKTIKDIDSYLWQYGRRQKGYAVKKVVELIERALQKHWHRIHEDVRVAVYAENYMYEVKTNALPEKLPRLVVRYIYDMWSAHSHEGIYLTSFSVKKYVGRDPHFNANWIGWLIECSLKELFVISTIERLKSLEPDLKVAFQPLFDLKIGEGETVCKARITHPVFDNILYIHLCEDVPIEHIAKLNPFFLSRRELLISDAVKWYLESKKEFLKEKTTQASA